MIKIGEGFGVSNFRSFDKKGIFLKNINKINVLIGKNNSGKSNLLLFLRTLSDSINNTSIGFPDIKENSHRQIGSEPNLIFYYFLSELGIVETYPSNNPNRQSYQDILGPGLKLIFPLCNKDVVSTTANFQKLSNQGLLNLLNKLTDTSSRTVRAEDHAVIHSINKVLFGKIKERVVSLPKVIYIPNFRYIKEGNKIEESNSEIDGSNIISEMFKMQNPEIGEERTRDNLIKIEEFVRELLNVDELKLEIPHTKDKIIVELYGNRLPLDYFGTGIHQLVILCTAIVINPVAIICIEEPEIHIHPELQRKFLRFLESTENIYFISTHSNVFLDYSPHKSIYHVRYDGRKSTIDYINSTSQAQKILDDLGYKQSDLLQTNGIIWVEGPSDRIYIKKWLSLIDNSLVEGLNYSIMFYGGRLLSHLTLKSEYFEKHLIPLLRVNRNAIVIIDKDAKRAGDDINSTKRRISEELGEKNCWITEGREIENYLSVPTIESWLKQKSGKAETYELGKYSKLEEVTTKIGEEQTFDYSKNKVKYASEIVPHITVNDIDTYDLDERLKYLISQIKEWNG